MNLDSLGWNPAFSFYLSEQNNPNLFPARATQVHAGICHLFSERGPIQALYKPPLPFLSDDDLADTLAVGDWCAVMPRADRFEVSALFERKTIFSRGRAEGARAEQIIAANVDVAFLVTGLDGDFSVRRIERYLALTRKSGARPVIVLNKADLCEDVAGRIDASQRVAPDATVIAISAANGEGVEQIESELSTGLTGAFLGSSGVGKSTLINRLLGEDRLKTQPVRSSDERGKHTTTRRELIPLPNGGSVIDTPGMREVGLIGDQESLDEGFPEIFEAAASCKFSDCRHEEEPGCAVRAAIEADSIDVARLESYHRLLRELEAAGRRKTIYQQRAYERQTYGRYRKQIQNLKD